LRIHRIIRKGTDMLTVKILGPGCANCKRLEEVARKAAGDAKVEAEFVKVTDYNDILAYSILSTPGLVINEKWCLPADPVPRSSCSMDDRGERRQVTLPAGGAAASDWHRLEPGEVSQRLGVDPAAGHSFDEAARRLALHGPNALTEAAGRSVARMVFDQFADVMILILLAAAVIAGVMGEAADTIAILVIVLLNAAIGFVQEYRAEKAVAALRQMAAPSARVRRQGEVRELPAHELVPGDVVLLEAGNVVPADLRLVDVARLRVAEAALTGESQPVEKATAAIAARELPLGDRRNMAFKGTAVTYGRAAGIAIATGMGTELGRIASLLAGAEELKTPLQRRLTKFGARLAVAVLVICALVFATGLLRGEPPAILFLTAVSLAVAAIPEALPAVVAISLALGAYKMVGQHALIRRLPAVETLGSITTICSDKTGTLTENRMRAEAFELAGEATPPALPAPRSRAFFEALALCNDARVDHAGRSVGDPTEVALLDAAIASGLDIAALALRSPRVAELPFDSERKLMATAHSAGDGVLVYVKGAPEALLQCCTRQAAGDASGPTARRWIARRCSRTRIAWPQAACACWRWLAGGWMRFPPTWPRSRRT
jgi:Ca2+-transporting ATPase